ncbi:MAG: acetylornithine/succinyldiaminopimelate transaminase [Succinivibrio sp.]|nr:acetylornithine/succinyldiaminopimelate transaminase [Succinivibrio sp.]
MSEKVTRKTFDEVMFSCYKPMDFVIDHAHGCKVVDTQGREYLDLTSGIAVNVLGHTPKKVVKIASRQCEELMHCSNIFTNKQTLTLASKLVSQTDFDRVFFVNSGAEANEAALKLARRVAFNQAGEDKNEIIAFNNSFHGRTFFSVSVGGQHKYSDGFGPKPAAITHIAFNDLSAFKKTISDKTCAVILEPVQGEGGIIPVDEKFLKEVRALCTKHHAMLIFDEVQTGVGRTGYFYAYQKLGIVPDALTTAKGLGSGLPIGALLAKEEFAKHFTAGTHGSTFGGNPVCCAIGSYIVDKVSDPDFLAKVRAKGAYLAEQLQKLGRQYQCFVQVRGEGLLLGAVLSKKYAGQSGRLQQCCCRQGLLTLVAGSDVLRLAPPLNIKRKELDRALVLLEQALIDFVREQD